MDTERTTGPGEILVCLREGLLSDGNCSPAGIPVKS